MSSNDDSWARRRGRLTKCKKHGLHFDPELTSGCALCRKEGTIAAPERSGAQFLVLLIVLLGLAALAAGLVSNIRARRGAGSAAEEEVATSSKLDPSPLRPGIEALERALAEPPEAGLSSYGSEVRSAVEELRVQVERQDSETARSAALALSEWAASIPEAGFTPAELERSRNTWKRISSRAFKAASWWRPLGAAASDAGRLTLLAYREAADDLVALADEGAAQLAAYSETEGPDPGWALFAEGWRQRIEEIGSRLPARGEFSGDARFLIGVQDLRSALSKLARLARDRSLPSKTTAPAQLEQAIEEAESARATFDSLLLG